MHSRLSVERVETPLFGADSPLYFLSPAPSPSSPPLSFVLSFATPVVASKQTAFLLAQVCNGSAATPLSVEKSDADAQSNISTLFSLLLPSVVRRNDSACIIPYLYLKKASQGGHYAIHVPNSNVSHVYFLGGQSAPAVTVARVPFASPSQLFSILQVCPFFMDRVTLFDMHIGGMSL